MIVRILFIGLLFVTPQLWGQTVNQKDTQGRKQGAWQKTYPKSRAFEYKGQFKDDKPVGTFYYYYASTKKKAIVTHDVKTGRSTSVMYHENGVLMAKGIFRNQEKDSVWEYYGPSGRLSTKETYSNGKLNGNQTVYYIFEDPMDKRVVVAKVTPYKMGVIHGDVIEYFDTGIIKSKVNYVNGKKEGIAVTNHPNGKVMITERFKGGIQHGWQSAHDQTGKETGKQYYRYGKRIEGKELEAHLKQCKAKGINPNG
jgi:antitoxin component YwqK of YwqJK toxin-antitoxin module